MRQAATRANDAARFLADLGEVRRKPGLERVRFLMHLFGLPHQEFRCVHVAGTNGKGSTSAMIASVLAREGLAVGLYTSPHLVSLRERIQVSGEFISSDMLTKLIEEVHRLTKGEDDPPSFFEVVTACALKHFSNTNVDIAVLETGLGGRLDATNIVEPEVAVLTSLSIDHESWLGRSLYEIAGEKAGIIKPGIPVVSCWSGPEERAVLEEKCARVHAPLRLLDRDFHVELIRPWVDGAPAVISYSGPRWRFDSIRLPLFGLHQVQNAALAIAGLEVLAERGFEISEAGVNDGMASVKWPGRLEMIQGEPGLILDGAHNPEAVKALAETIPFLSYHGDRERRILLFAASCDKDTRAMLSKLSPFFSTLVATSFGGERAGKVEDLAGNGNEFFNRVVAEEDTAKALERARKLAGPNGLVVAAGSLFLVGAIKKIIQEKPEDPYIFQ
ncbi:MAG: bifunctional folylpolyglutamate synthase/dihydrofolate synthase [Deltaproteobacteria bacterium]|nr:bifunctional folylpolyglutamate synthase/dihydrofolate synthase [Deltaproteobacteria bacterium]